LLHKLRAYILFFLFCSVFIS